MYLRNILLVIGVFALVAGASLTILWLAQRPSVVAVSPSTSTSPPQEAQKASKAILVAAHAIPSGTFLRAEDVTWKEVADNAPADPMEIARDAAADSKYVGAVTATNIAGGEPLLVSALVKPGDRSFLTTLLTPGTRAISIAVDAAQSESGLLLAGNRVDIILTQTFENSPDQTRKSVGETILKNLRVIAVDQRLGPVAAGDKKPAPDAVIPKIVTLEVTERQAQALMVAARLGRIEVALRSLKRPETDETGPAEIGPLWAADVSPALRSLSRPVVASTAPAPRPAPAVLPPAPPARKPIEVMHGSKIEAR
ncbi:MAG TPA: Flp pilus assembly protein CpaB [Micropepsaceae bacterium]|nr:Flp pilus assembly protein CpaB [Micropepsaceae bacterium]